MVKEVGFFVGLAFLNGVELHLPLSVFFFDKLKNHPSRVEVSIKALSEVNRSMAIALQSFLEDPAQLDMDQATESAFYWTVVIKEEGVLKWIVFHGDNMSVQLVLKSSFKIQK